MKIDWRVSAIAAGSAFLLSVLVGVIGNVSFGVLILRAIVAAAIFGAGAVGVSLLIARYLPELKNTSTREDAAGSGGVDIVVEGDEGLHPEDTAEQSDGFAGIETDSGAESDDEEVAELSAVEGDEDEDGGDAAAHSDGSEEIIEEIEEVEEDEDRSVSGTDVEEAEEASDADEVSEAEDVSDAEELPGVDSMSDSFTEVPLGDEIDEGGGDSGEDPAVMAKAIRTVLKREE